MNLLKSPKCFQQAHATLTMHVPKEPLCPSPPLPLRLNTPPSIFGGKNRQEDMLEEEEDGGRWCNCRPEHHFNSGRKKKERKTKKQSNNNNNNNNYNNSDRHYASFFFFKCHYSHSTNCNSHTSSGNLPEQLIMEKKKNSTHRDGEREKNNNYYNYNKLKLN